MVNYGWSDIYSNTSGKIFIDFPIKFYTITPWIQDALELPMTLGGSNPVTVDTKNNFFIGIDNVFSFENAIDMELNFEFCLGSSLGINPNTDVADDTEIRLTPCLSLSAEYDFGFSWEIANFFEMYFFPNVSNNTMQFTDIEGFYSLEFEFLHFPKIKNYQLSLYSEMYLLARLLNYGRNNEDYYGNFHLLKNLDPAAGLSFEFYGIETYLLFFYHTFGTADGAKLTGSWAGIKSGIEYTKDWLTLDITYYGTINTDPKADGKRQNHVETLITFSL